MFLHGQAFGEEADDIAPGPLRVAGVVADAGAHGVVDRRVVEGVQGSAVAAPDPLGAAGVVGGEKGRGPAQESGAGIRRRNPA
jgi:hypothetical protein